MIIRRTRFDDLDDWLDTVDWQRVKENTGAPMMKLIRLYIRYVGKLSEFVGEGAMYLLLAIMAMLLYSIFTNAIHRPVIWVMEMSQFTMAAYYILGGASSLKHGIHVRMDFVYERWKARTKAMVDLFTVFFLLFYLYIMIRGGWDSSMFALEFDQRNHSVWKPPMAPVKITMTVGMALMFLQAVAELLKDFCRAIGRKY